MLQDLGRRFITDVSGPLKTEPICCPETFVANYRATPRNITEQRKSEPTRWKPKILNESLCVRPCRDCVRNLTYVYLIQINYQLDATISPVYYLDIYLQLNMFRA